VADAETGPGRPRNAFILADDATQAVASADVQVRDRAGS
jgi:hypothetical protein